MIKNLSTFSDLTNNFAVARVKKSPGKRTKPTDDETPRYSCTQCKYVTNRSDHYKRHLMTHSADKPLKCTLCSYGTGRSDHYKRHLQRHGMSERVNKSFSWLLLTKQQLNMLYRSFVFSFIDWGVTGILNVHPCKAYGHYPISEFLMWLFILLVVILNLIISYQPIQPLWKRIKVEICLMQFSTNA